MDCLSCSSIALAGSGSRPPASWPLSPSRNSLAWTTGLRGVPFPVKLRHRWASLRECHSINALRRLGERNCERRIPQEERPRTSGAAMRAASSRSEATTTTTTLGSTASIEASFSKENFEAFLLHMQQQICEEAATADGSGKEFLTDQWERSPDSSAGYGITRVLEGGDLLEKAAANVSIVRGRLSETRAKAMSARGRGVEAGASYFAGALSLVFHARSPHVPTFRSDIRYFEVEGSPGWFGGGADLTPSYMNEEEFRNFHRFYRAICQQYHPTLYVRCKASCDRYFFIPARKEHRGIGGIFFDDMADVGELEGEQVSGELGHAQAYSFVRDVALGFMPSYLPIAERARNIPYGDQERQWQLLRRGRYIEFNLLYDRGVRFGLDGGRVESIMVSAPPLIAWKYNVTPEEGSPEADMLKVLQTPQEWL